MNVRIAPTSGRITIEGKDEIKVCGCQSGDLMTLIGQIQIETRNSGSRTVMNKKSVQLGGLYTRSDKYVQTVGFQTAAVRVEQCLVVYLTEEEIEMKSRDR